MKYIDLHCDTLIMFSQPWKHRSLIENRKMISFNKLKKGAAMAQFFAIFLPPPGFNILGKLALNTPWLNNFRKTEAEDDAYIKKLSSALFNEIERCDFMAFARSYDDLMRSAADGKISAFLTIEDGRSVNGKLEKLKKYYDIGVRMITLTWNNKNCFGSPHSDNRELMSEGLSDFGKEAVSYMQELGMIVDVSHLSDGGFWDVVNIHKKPFVASHSNCRSICPNTRGLTDEMLKALGNSGSVTGINFGDNFLSKLSTSSSSSKSLNCTTHDVVMHAKHIAGFAGIEAVAIGTDFDGTHVSMEISDCSYMPLLFDALKKAGFSESDIEKIAYKNVLRVIKDTLR